MKLHDYFKQFLTETVNLNRSRIDRLDGHVTAIDGFIAGDATLSELSSGELVAQGSYAQRTIIKPVGSHGFDADVLMPMNVQDGWEPKQYVGALYTALRGSPVYREKTSRGTRCVEIDYASDFHMDIVPYLLLPDGPHITNRHDNVFEETNPEGFNEWLDAKDRVTGGRLTEVIRVMKYLRDFKQRFTVRSVVLTYLLAERVDASNLSSDPKYYADSPTALVNIMEDLDSWMQARPTLPSLPDSMCASQDFSDRWDQTQYTSFRDRIHGYAAKARAAYDETDKALSLAGWQAIFGPDFKAPPATPVVEASVALATHTDTEQFLARDLGIQTNRAAGYAVSVRCTVDPYGRQRERRTLARLGNRVPRDRWLTFDIIRCTVPKPHTVYWKVRNYGSDAEAKDEIRGQIISNDTATLKEHTAYRGDHHVEAYIVKNGVCVARNRQRVTVT